MPESSNGGPADLLVVHHCVPALASADPRTRQVFRRVDLLHRLTGGRVRVVALEEDPGADVDALVRLGVPLRIVAGGVASGMLDELAHARAAWVTGVLAGEVLVAAIERSGRDLPYVLDLDQAPSAVAAASGLRIDARNTDGLEHLVEVRRAREHQVLAGATAVAVSNRDLADQLGPDVDATVLLPCVVPQASGRRASQRAGAIHYGRWVSEDGHPDEDGLLSLAGWLGDDAGRVTRLLSQDAPPRLRLGLTGRFAVADPFRWRPELRTARAVVVPRRFGTAQPATVAEVLAEGVPLLASPGVVRTLPDSIDHALVSVDHDREWPERLGRLLDDRHAWAEAAAATEQAAARWLDPATIAEQTAGLLAALGVPCPAPAERPRPDTDATDPERLVLPGGTARSSLDLRGFEARLQGPALFPRLKSLELQGHLTGDEGYRMWAAAHDDNDARQEMLRRRAETFARRPTISIVMPTYDSDPVHLMEAIASVRSQTWEHWQLCIADDGSPDPRTRATLERYIGVDDRIVVLFNEENQGIAATTNAALGAATGDYVGFLDHDDVLRPTALHWIVELLQEEPDLDVVYTDEDRLDSEGRPAWPSFKPDWSPDLLNAVNYMSHLTVIRRSIVEELGGLRTGFDGSQDYDLLLRVTERTQRVGHVAKPLYSWRMTERSTATSSDAKPEADDAGRRALADALDRRGVDASIRPGYVPTWHDVRYRVATDPLISAIIPTRDRVELLRECVQKVRQTAGHQRVEIVVVDNDSRDPETLAYLADLERAPDAMVVRYPERFNYARQMNLAAAAATGELLLLLNNDARPLTADWLEVLAGHALRPEVGAVGARLLFPDGVAQHEGIALHIGGAVAWNIRAAGLPTLAYNTRNTSAVTGACLMVRRGVFDAVGGLDEQLRVAFNDVDFCRRIGELGYRIVYTPWAELEHAESASRGLMHPDDDEQFYRDRWGEPMSERDPFYGTALDMADPIARFRI
jgi:GT2 family glycosyltransferase